MRFFTFKTNESGNQTTVRFHRSSTANNQGFAGAQYIDVVTDIFARQLQDDAGKRITNGRRIADLRKALILGD